MVDLAGISSTALNIFVLVMSILVFGGLIVGGVWFYLQYKRFSQFKCVIFERDGFGQLIETYDKAGVFVDNKTKNKRLFLKKNKVGLDPDTIPYLPSVGGKRIIYLLKTGLKNFHYLNINVTKPGVTLSVGEEDVNWGINAYERGKKMFSQSLLMQLLPFIAIAFTTIIILIIFIYFFKNFDVLADVAEALQKAAEAYAQAETGTVVIEGG